ncbi:MAG: restriction endonuclease [Legionellales bacterium]|nr:restriction endonuclease [Legionellales bacterium]
MKYFSDWLYHLYQYQIKPSSRHRKVIRQAKLELQRLRSLDQQYPPEYLIGILRNIDPFVFEEMLLLCFKERQFRVKRNKRHTGDGGIDGIVINSVGQTILIQAKRYRNAINPQHVREFCQLVEMQQAGGGFFIHTGRTGEKSKRFIANHTVKIVSGNRLLNLILGEPV